MSDTAAARIALVRTAAASGLSNCFDWLNDEVVRNIAQRSDLKGLTPVAIKRIARDWIAHHDGAIREKVEDRPVGIDRRDYWYFVVIPIDPVEDFPRGLFVEMELTDPDSECTVVSLLNAHPELEGPRLSEGGVFLS